MTEDAQQDQFEALSTLLLAYTSRGTRSRIAAFIGAPAWGAYTLALHLTCAPEMAAHAARMIREEVQAEGTGYDIDPTPLLEALETLSLQRPTKRRAFKERDGTRMVVLYTPDQYMIQSTRPDENRTYAYTVERAADVRGLRFHYLCSFVDAFRRATIEGAIQAWEEAGSPPVTLL